MIEQGSLEYWKYIAVGVVMCIKAFSWAIGSYWIYRAVKEYWINKTKERLLK